MKVKQLGREEEEMAGRLKGLQREKMVLSNKMLGLRKSLW